VDNNQTIRLSQDVYERLKQELDELIANRPAMAAEINARREEGDLKESGGYMAAREEQDRQEARIRQLQELLRAAQVGDVRPASGVAAPGMVLTVQYEGDDETEEFLLATREEGTLGSLEVYSPGSPLGQALLGAKVGERRKYVLPNGNTMTVMLIKAVPYGEIDESNEHGIAQSGEDSFDSGHWVRATTTGERRPHVDRVVTVGRADEDRLARSEATVELAETYRSAVAGQRRIYQVMPPATDAGHAHRTLPISVFLATDANASEVELALVELLDAFGIDITESMPPIIGSWFGLMLARFRRWLASDQAEEVLTRIERAVELHMVDQPQADVDSKQAESVARLTTALEKQETACIQVGSLFLIKVDGILVARNLSPTELSFLGSHPTILSTPRQVLNALESLSGRPSSRSAGEHETRIALPSSEVRPYEP
jgi:transcription elongation factor GreA